MNQNRKNPEFEPFSIEPDALKHFADDVALEAALSRPEVQALVLAVVEYCAEIGDAYTDDEGCCGTEFRSHFGLM